MKETFFRNYNNSNKLHDISWIHINCISPKPFFADFSVFSDYWHFLDFNVSTRDFKTDVNKISKSVLTVSCWWSAASCSGHSGGQTKKIFWGHIFKHHSLNGRWVQKSSNQLIYLSWMKYIVHTYFNA